MRYRIVFWTGLTLLGWAGSGRAESEAELIAFIDRQMAASWTKANVVPCSPVGDSGFLRRASLDLAGRIPTVHEVRTFQADTRPNRRGQLVERLLRSPGYARHWANLWRRTFLPQAETQAFARLAPPLERWLTTRLANGVSYDQLVEALLVGTGRPEEGSASRLFLAASESKPENLAANSSRVFLGLNLDCAQCHNHPFARWTKKQFWEYAAFFAEPARERDRVATRLELPIPETDRTVTPRLLTGMEPKWPAVLGRDTGRQVLARWITAKDNPYFARNAVNRVWAQVFGVGLVEPLDDLSDRNPSSHPELHARLAKAFVASGHDLRFLLRVLVATRSYSLSSHGPRGKKSTDPRLFARMTVRGLSGEQLYDSLRLAAGLPLDAVEGEYDVGSGFASAPPDTPRRRFVRIFRDDRVTMAPRSILQALELMNGPITGEATRSKTVSAATDAPFLTETGRIETVFLAALSRGPSAEELARWLPTLRSNDPTDRRRALGDLFWVLVNSTEFSVNH